MAMERIRVSFFIKKDKLNPNGESAIYCKIRNSQYSTSLVTGYWVNHDRWTKTKRLTSSRMPGERDLLLKLSEFSINVQEVWQKWQRYMPIKDLEKFKAFYNDPSLSSFGPNQDKKDSLNELFKFHIDLVERRVQTEENTIATQVKVKRALRFVGDMIRTVYGVEDFRLSELNLEFIDRHFHFLKTEKKHCQNTALKDIAFLKSAIITGIAHGWMKNNPFIGFKKKKQERHTTFLTDAEIQLIENKIIETPRLDLVRDLFLFGIYTGYSCVDVSKLTSRHIIVKEDGRRYLIKKRTKTINSVAQPCEVPILPPVERLLDKYSKDERCVLKGFLLPDLTNQTLNVYLKELQTICGISKKLHYHLARHTFATTVTLSKGISIEVVARMLGHKRLATTQHYAKLVSQRVSEETEKLYGIYT